MASLRNRIGLLAAAVTLIGALAGAIGITVERWREETSSTVESLELASFQLAETTNVEEARRAVDSGSSAFAILFDAEGNVQEQAGEVELGLIDNAREEIWQFTTNDGLSVVGEYETSDGRIVVLAGVGCGESTDCDTAVVGATELSFFSYVIPRLGWILIPVGFFSLLAWMAARWLVGRSLRPVDAMRSELEAITATDLDRRVVVPKTDDELQLLGGALNQTVERLGSAVRANERFVADAAHELRSPITGAKAAFQVYTASDPGPMHAAGIGELDRASRLIDDLLALARRQGALSKRIDVDLDDVARTEISMASTRSEDITIEQKLLPARLVGDPDALRRVVANLLDNAIRYGKGLVRLEVGTDGGTVWLTVEDNGAGIPDEEKGRVFERFARLDESRARDSGGSGLGLAIVAELVADHQGTVTVTDSPLGGAKFKLVF